MPNLAGVFDMRDQPGDTSGMMEVVARVLDVPGVNYTTASWSDDRFAAVNLLNGICGGLDQPATSEDNRVLFIDGEIYELRELWAREFRNTIFPGTASACLDLYARHGNKFVSELNGQFNILIYEPADRTVKLFNDRLAYRPFYYWCSDGLAVFGLEKKAIFAALDRLVPLDPMGTLEFVTFGHNLGDRTVFSGLRVMQPGSVLEISNGRAEVSRYWRMAYNNSSAGSLNDSADEFGRRLSKAVERRVGKRRCGIYLSGGLDSRAAAGPLAALRDDVASFTFGSDSSPDLIYGRMLASKLGFVHNRLSYEEISFADVAPQVVWRTEGAIPFHQTLSILHHQTIRAQADIMFNGQFGDALTGGHLLPGQFVARNFKSLAKHIVQKRSMIHLPMLRAVFDRSFLDEAYPEMIRSIERFLSNLQEDRLPLAHSLWDMLVRQTRFSFCSASVDRYVVEQITPFIDNDVVDWMLQMPLRYLLGQRVYKRMIIRSFEQIADVPWARTGRPISTNFAADMGVQAWIYGVKRLRTHGNGSSAVDPRLSMLRELVTAGPGSDNLPDAIFNQDGVRRVTAAAAEGRVSSTVLFVLATLAETTRLLGSGGLTGVPEEARPTI